MASRDIAVIGGPLATIDALRRVCADLLRQKRELCETAVGAALPDRPNYRYRGVRRLSSGASITVPKTLVAAEDLLCWRLAALITVTSCSVSRPAALAGLDRTHPRNSRIRNCRRLA